MEKQFAVYIITNKKHGTLYIGVTSNLPKRIWEHKEKIVKGFTQRYGLDKLVYYELHDNAETAIHFEKKLKNRSRQFKIDLIETQNPKWQDLYDDII